MLASPRGPAASPSSPLSLIPALEPWQQRAVDAFRVSTHPTRGPRHGIFDVFTGGGKSVLALAAMVDAASAVPGLRFALVVPTVALQEQWATLLPKLVAGLSPTDIGRRGGAGAEGSFERQRVVIYVLPSAVRHLADDVRGHEVMLVVDECHRAGSERASTIFEATTRFRLGLSATPERTDWLDEHGSPLPLSEQPHGRALGPVCFRLTLRDAADAGLLPPFELHHHRLELSDEERGPYAELSRRCLDAERTFWKTGARAGYLAYAQNRVRGATSEQRSAGMDLQRSYFERKRWLFGVAERDRVARTILADAASRAVAAGRVLLAMVFSERIGSEGSESPDDDATMPASSEGDDDVAVTAPNETSATSGDGALALAQHLRADVEAGRLAVGPRGVAAVGVEHSGKSAGARRATLDAFRRGDLRILVSVKALTEGIDVPDADLGLSVASTSSARQRIQTMGRLLRARRDAKGVRLAPAGAADYPKELHLLYIGDTVDQQLYVERDWAAETGDRNNHWWRWSRKSDVPTVDDDPPRPPPSEEEAWKAIAKGPFPQPWGSAPTGERWTFRGGAVVRGQDGPKARDGREASELLTKAGKRAEQDFRGAFLVTPKLWLVLKRASTGWVVCGRLGARLETGDGPSGVVAAAASPTDDNASERGVNAAPTRSPAASKKPFDVRTATGEELSTTGKEAFAKGERERTIRCRDELARRAEKNGKAKLLAWATELSTLLSAPR